MVKIRLGDYCCQGGNKIIDLDNFQDRDLVISNREKNTLVFSPLGNNPNKPLIALVGITPGSQSEVFARLLCHEPVEKAAANAAFANGQDAIKKLLRAHDFASTIGIKLAGDLNKHTKIFTTSLVKCCLKVDGSYKYKAPDISASPEASFCLSNRFIGDIAKFPSLKWVIIFGDAGWDAVNQIQYKGQTIRKLLESMGLNVLKFPHFAQNFQQRAIFRLSPEEEEEYFNRNPSHKKYATKARHMRTMLIQAMETPKTLEEETNFDIEGPLGDSRDSNSSHNEEISNSAIKRPVPQNEVFSRLFYLLHQSGDKLYPARQKNRDTGRVSFRVSKGGAGGNTKQAGLEVEDEHQMREYVLEQGYAVRAATLNRSRCGLFKIGQRSIIRAVENNSSEICQLQKLAP